MPPKRRKRGPAPNKGLAPGESLKRYLVPTQNSQHALWTWVGSEVSRAADITPEHCLMAYGLSSRNSNPLCMNKYTVSQVQPSQTPVNEKEPTTEEGDIIVISDDEGDRCTKKNCKLNPNCLNYLGQEKWENEEIAMQEFLKVATVGYNPTEDTRILELPVGLRNLGATCYANASLQVWYRNLAFRGGVYQCQLQSGADMVLKDSPLFQLQVTFAALQEGSCKTFNPASLVESLHLRAAEQQDAQEFSKLFMSHLDVEFKKQSVPELRSLISNQFQGTQLYGTICDTCGYRSERKSDFLELEIRFESNSKLEDCIGTMLQEEKLTGDNQYRCPQCNDLRDATRYTQLSQLPPILHFSLLRFVYDFSTMERRKSKYTISFPTTLDMNQFLKDDTEATAQQQDQDINVYELAGILLHKGASAYHGHYEAQVYDTEKRSWFQFNDEVVTRIETLGDKKKVKEKAIIVDDDDDSSSKRPAKKRRKVVSDDETESSQPKSPSSRSISSRDAYMLIYVRRSDQYNTDTSTPVPPQQALEFVHTLNKDYEEECKSFVQKEESIKERFALIRQQVMDVYRRWNATSVSDDCVILGQKWLQKWLTQDCMRLAQPTLTITESETNGIEEKQVEPNSEDQQPILDDRILCSHQKLDPAKAKYMKRIKRDIYQKMVELTGCRYEDLSSQDVCQECVLLEFNERLYNIDHPRFVKEFEVIPEVEDNSGYWISKKWLKDWRLLKPKMHKPSEEDPAPDSAEYRDDVLCEHGALALNSSTRRRISEEAMQFLKSLFPLWNPIRGVVEPCAACDALVYVSKEDKRELRRRAEEEKALLKFMYEGTPFTAEDDSFVVIPMDFFRGWLSWLNSPADHKRSEKLDNSPFFCEHGLLAFDPNCPSDMEMIVTIIRQRDWEILETLYDSGPRVGLKKAPQNDDDKLYEPEIPVCEDCRLKRKTEWVYTEIIVQLIHGTETSTKRKPIATYSTKNGTRQSKRLRQARENEKRRFAVTKQTTVKDIKVKIQENFKIPTICQRLFFRGQELQENEATVESLQVFTNEVLDLREENEVHEIGSDFEEGQPSKKQRRETERGFGGTVLSGEYEPERQSSCSCEDTPHGITPVPSEKTCTVCTLLNAYDAIACQVCGTIFV